jgi:hypothetical protein
MKDHVSVFKYARIVDPYRAWALLHVADPLEEAVKAGEKGAARLIKKLAHVLPALRENAALIMRLQDELPKYLLATRDATLASGLTAGQKSAARSEWWANHKADLPAWAELAYLVFLISPTSAAVERCFSILRRTFEDDQKTALEDYVETSVMLQYNSRPGSGLAPP